MKTYSTPFMRLVLHRVKTAPLIKEALEFLIQNKTVFLIIICTVVCVDGFFIRRSSDFVYFGVLALYGVYATSFKTKSSLAFSLSLGISLGLGISFLTSQASIATEKLSVWLFLFLLAGIIQGWFE